MRLLVILIVLIFLDLSCKNNPVKPDNHRPIISSLTVFPEIVGLSDSVIVTCLATDPDGDTLVYDWITDGRVRIKENPDWRSYLYNTYQNSHIFYPKDIPRLPSLDTLWIQCFARDGKGMSDNGLVLFILSKDKK